MTGGTDHEIGTEGYYAAIMLERERIDDAVYAVRAYAKTLSWGALLLAVSGLCAGLATKNWMAVATSLTGIVGVFLPQLNSTIVNQVILTALMSSGKIARPAGESLITPPKAKIGESYVRPAFHVDEDPPTN